MSDEIKFGELVALPKPAPEVKLLPDEEEKAEIHQQTVDILTKFLDLAKQGKICGVMVYAEATQYPDTEYRFFTEISDAVCAIKRTGALEFLKAEWLANTCLKNMILMSMDGDDDASGS